MTTIRMDQHPRDQVDELLERTEAIKRSLDQRQPTPRSKRAQEKAEAARAALKELRDEVSALRPDEPGAPS